MKRRVAIAIGLVCVVATAPGQSFYKNSRGLFSTRPGETSSLTNIKRFGPVGMGIDLIQLAFTMRISHIAGGQEDDTT